MKTVPQCHLKDTVGRCSFSEKPGLETKLPETAKHEAIRSIFCFDYSNYHSSCQFFYSLLTYYLIISPEKLRLSVSLLTTESVWRHLFFFSGVKSGGCRSMVSMVTDCRLGWQGWCVSITGPWKWGRCCCCVLLSFSWIHSWKLLATFLLHLPPPP